MVPNLSAIHFIKFMSSGRTSPALCGCETPQGVNAGEYVVKLRGAIGNTGSLNEFVGVQLASYFNLAVPSPALIAMEQELIQQIAFVAPEKSTILADSVGINFGSKVLIGNATWPVDKGIPEVMLQSATEIFAFDALTQNPDRRHNNANILTVGDSITIFDHEASFSFLFAIFPSATPWLLGDQTYLANHVFSRALKSKPLNLNDFTERLSNLDDDQIDLLVADCPNQWKNGNWSRIKQHLRIMREHCEEFSEEIRRVLI